MPQSIINTKNPAEADVHIISAPYDATASFHKGTAEGPRKVVECLHTQIEFFDKRFKVESTEKIKIAETEIAGLQKMNPENAHNAVVSACENSKAPLTFLLGGEHSMSFGSLKALAKKHKPSDVTIFQIDAHCDLRVDDSDYTDGEATQYAHSAVMRRAHEMGYKLVQVGIRAFSKDEYEYFIKNKKTIATFPWGATKPNGQLIVPTIQKILASIKTKKVYISIDVDGIDPAYMPGTGTPVQGGLEWWYTLKLLETIIEKRTLVGADVVEVSPVADNVLTEYGAAQIVYNMINTFYKSKLVSKKK
ncbi:MAG: agmatinase [bacterium]